MPTSDEVFEKVRETLVDALGVDDDEVTPQATLIGDLGAESIDFLDIVFRLEKNFDIKIPRGELFPENLTSAESGFVADGVVTAAGLDELRKRMPHADIDTFAKDPEAGEHPGAVHRGDDLQVPGVEAEGLSRKRCGGGSPRTIAPRSTINPRRFMRWFWIDRFIEFESGKHCTAVKNVTLAEEHLHDHFPGFPVMPGSLIIEGMAQTGGILLGETHQFQHMVILAKIPKTVFHSWACPGDTLHYHAVLEDVRAEGGWSPSPPSAASGWWPRRRSCSPTSTR